MAVNRLMRTALRALSYTEVDLGDQYQFQKKIISIANHRHKLPYKVWDHVVAYENHAIPVRIFTPSENESKSILLFFHGGGWVTGFIDSYNRVCASLAEMTGCTVVSVDYRSAPEYRFPAAPEDCYRVAREIFLDSSLFQTEADQITLMGDSAGGNLAAAVSLMARDRGEFLPARQILLYPAAYHDHTDRSPYASARSSEKKYLLTAKRINDYMALYMADEKDLQNPYFAPLASKDFSNQPSTLIITAEHDPLRDEAEDYGRRLEQAGNTVEVHQIPNALHGFFTMPPVFSQVRDCYKIINDFLNAKK
ncbi:alpha/beta hydrolase [Caproiciproducens galactitolivorans]|uniref:Alpha/beta hydrolase n=1 Tax=Caproiciproducens galactitolivorans TaxID=642589 RepID=A0ABT4BTA1_9FIRM|nr:alpha/beta hydrolase [Caproiciproducens galactitolivorans]MCY1714117.1 alpha/beta hydrolase [Caproiciproducens galactitolivorans]